MVFLGKGQNMTDIGQQTAALAAAERFKDADFLGIGSGSTVQLFLEALAEICFNKPVLCVASESSALIAKKLVFSNEEIFKLT